MDVGSVALAAVSAQAESRAQLVAAKILRQNVDNQRSVLQLIDAASQNLDQIVAKSGLGQSVDVTA